MIEIRIADGIYDSRSLVRPMKSVVAMMPNPDTKLPYDGARVILEAGGQIYRDVLALSLTEHANHSDTEVCP